MTLIDSRHAFAIMPDRATDALAAAALSDARRLAANEMGATIAHQLVEPLTALLLYIHELQDIENAASDGLIDSALRETERVCAIVQRIGRGLEAAEDVHAISAARDSLRPQARIAAEALAPPARRFDYLLTRREREVLTLITEGGTNKEGALRLQISPRTFESHRAQIMRKLGARNAADLLRKVLTEQRQA